MSDDLETANRCDTEVGSKTHVESDVINTYSQVQSAHPPKGILSKFVQKVCEALPKTIVQGTVALLVAYLGAQWGFWGNISAENYRQRVEAVSILAGDGAEFAQIVRAFFNARINALHHVAAFNRFGRQRSSEEAQYWYRRSEELLVEMCRSKGHFRRSLATVRLLFPKHKELLDQLSTTERTRVVTPQDRTASAKTLAELELIRKQEMESAGERVNQELVPAIDRLFEKLVEELAQRPHGTK